jgi:hypothetical protein
VVVGLLGGRAEAQSPSPPPTPTPAPGRLKLDIDRHVEQRLAEEERKGTPRFETQVEVVGKSPQVMLDRYFGGVDLECPPGGAPPDGGAPSEVEMREARWHLSPYADFLALGKFIADKLNGKGGKAERYFLYRVRAGDKVSYLLREGRAPDTLLYGAPGTTFELVDAFPDLDSGTRAWRRMERGFPTPVGPTASPPAAWQATTCRAWR